MAASALRADSTLSPTLPYKKCKHQEVGGGGHSVLNKQFKAGWEFQNVFYTKGRMTVPKQLTLWKRSKGGMGGVIFNQKTYCRWVQTLPCIIERLSAKAWQ